MKKFSDITDKETSMEFDKEDQQKDGVSSDIETLEDQIEKQIKGTELEGEWEITDIIDVSTKPPKTNEAIIINAELGDKKVKRGEFIYITAMINKTGASAYHNSQMGVLKVRVVEIYNSILVLNQLR